MIRRGNKREVNGAVTIKENEQRWGGEGGNGGRKIERIVI